jgi:hypothetical protein
MVALQLLLYTEEDYAKLEHTVKSDVPVQQSYLLLQIPRSQGKVEFIVIYVDLVGIFDRQLKGHCK